MIHDESLRAYVNLLREERDQAKADKTRIVKGVRSIPGIDVENLIRVGFGGTASAPRQEVRLTPVVVDALTRLFNDQILSDCGLKMRKNRLINDLTGNVLLTKEHLEAVRALVESDSAPLAGSNQPFPMMGLEKTSTLDPEE
jgi:hypothetical protein